MRFAVYSAAIVLSAVCAGQAFAGTVAIPLNEVRIVSFKDPVATVYMGNPMIAGVTIIDAKHAFILGKTFGNTNMIALDSNGKPIVNDRVSVYGQRVGEVTLNRGSDQYNYSCTAAHCESLPVPGDVKEYSNDTQTEIQQHEDAGAKAAVADAH